VVGIFAVLIALKRNKRLLAAVLSICIFIIVPGRTFRLFIILLLAAEFYLYLKKKGYPRVKATEYFGFWTILLIIGILIFSYIWCYVLVHFFEVTESHVSLYDFSNFFRFRANLYTTSVIIKEKLLLHGITEYQREQWDSYFPNYLHMSSMNTPDDLCSPHNGYFSIMLFLGVIPFVMLIYTISRILRKISMEDFFVVYVLPYMLTACILHDTFVDIRLFAIMTVWILPKPCGKQGITFRVMRRGMV